MIERNWKNPPPLNALIRDIDDAVPSFKNHVREVEKWLSIREAELNIKIPRGKSRMMPKTVRKQYEWRYAALKKPFLEEPDLFKISPATDKDRKGAVANALILNKQFRSDINRQQFIDESIQTLVDEGSVTIFVGWKYQKHEVTRLVPHYERKLKAETPEQEQMLLEALKNGEITEEQAYYDHLIAEKEETTIETTENRPELEVVDYDKIIFDPNCRGDISKAKFVARKIFMSLSDILEDGKYENLDLLIQKIQGERKDDYNSISDDRISDDQMGVQLDEFNFEDKARERMILTEYWGEWDIDGDGRTTPIVVSWVNGIIVRMEHNPYPDQKPPFVHIPFMYRRKSPYSGEPDAELIGDNQKIIGALTRGFIDVMGRSANGQIGMQAGALTPYERLKMERGEDYEFKRGVDPRQAFYMHEFPELSSSAIILQDRQQEEIDSITGVQSFTGGITGNSLGDSATGVRRATGAAEGRTNSFTERIKAGYIEIAKKIIAMNAVNLEDKEVIRVTDDKFVEIRRDVLAGQYDLDMTIMTAGEKQKTIENFSFILQAMGNNADAGFQRLVWEDIARIEGRRDLANRIRDYKPQISEEEKRIAELKIQLLEAQIENEKGKATENNAQAVLHEAKAEAEDAKSKNIRSNTDLLDIRFVKERFNVDHENNRENADAAHERRMIEKNQDFNLKLGEMGAGALLKPAEKGTPSSPMINEGGGEELRGTDTPTENVKDYLRK